MQMKKVILVFKTHFDIGFTQLSRDILEYYKGEMLDRAAGNGFLPPFSEKKRFGTVFSKSVNGDTMGAPEQEGEAA